MVFSLTPFFNEYEILEARLATLAGLVTRHVLGFSRFTHSGSLAAPPDVERIRRLAECFNVNVEVIDCTPTVRPNAGPYGREKGQRRMLIKGIGVLNDGDKILLSDLDEIPHPDAVRAACASPFGQNTLPCRMHVGKLNWRWVKPATVHHQICRVFPAGYLLDGGNLEEARLQHMPLLAGDPPEGWHLSWMGDLNVKLDAWADQHMRPYARTDLAVRGAKLFPGWATDADEGIEWTDDLPPYIPANRERFAHMMVDRP